MKWLFNLLSQLFGKNSPITPKSVILDQLNEPRPLPMGRAEFMKWSDRIMAGALIPRDLNQSVQTHIDSIRYALANMIIALGPTESHKPDAFFIHSLRKFAINQVADTLRKELFEAGKKRVAAKEAATPSKERKDSAENSSDGKDAQVLEFRGKEGEIV